MDVAAIESRSGWGRLELPSGEHAGDYAGAIRRIEPSRLALQAPFTANTGTSGDIATSRGALGAIARGTEARGVAEGGSSHRLGLT